MTIVGLRIAYIPARLREVLTAYYGRSLPTMARAWVLPRQDGIRNVTSPVDALNERSKGCTGRAVVLGFVWMGHGNERGIEWQCSVLVECDGTLSMTALECTDLVGSWVNLGFCPTGITGARGSRGEPAKAALSSQHLSMQVSNGMCEDHRLCCDLW
ncbi:hypothetical protein PENSPDRAFT_389839 [Peniophora sp. CONT]|nr:hypothetical protein PENSPDRAFT_389839 [Peniophora sp. CONT]